MISLSNKLTCCYLVILTILQTQKVIGYDVNDESIPIYQPIPTAVINPLLNCTNGLTTYMKWFSLNNRNYVAVSLSICGVSIFDITNLNEINSVFTMNGDQSSKSLMLSFSHSRSFLWVGESSGIFYAINISKLPFMVEVQSQSNSKLVVNAVYSAVFNNDIIFLLCSQELQIFDWRNKANGLVYKSSISVNALKITQIELIQQNQLALITTPNVGVQLYSLNVNKSDPSIIQMSILSILKPYQNYDVHNFNIIDDYTINIMNAQRGVSMYKIVFNQQTNSWSFNLISQQIDIAGNGGYSYISKNKKYIYVGMRVSGINVFDISQNSYQIVQVIKDSLNAQDVILSDDEDILLFTNSFSLQIFQKTIPNLNQNLPNLFLNNYQLIQYNWVKQSSSSQEIDYECVWQESTNLFYLVQSIYGVSVLKYSGSGILEPKSSIYNQQSTYSSNKLTFSKDNEIAYLTRSEAGLSIISFANPDSPKILKEELLFGQTVVNYSYIKFVKNFSYGLIANQVNLLIINVEEIQNPTLVTSFNTLNSSQGNATFNKFELSQDENYAFLVLLDFGIVVLDISDPTNPKFKSSLFTRGASDVKIIKNSFILIAANYDGLIVAKVENDYSLTTISQTQLFGLSYRLVLINGGSQVFITSVEYPTICLVDLENLYNPQVIQMIQKPNDYGYFYMCLSSNNYEMFVTSMYTLYNLQLKSKIIFHTQVYQLQTVLNTNTITRQVVAKGAPLLVGQQIEIHIIPIYQQLKTFVSSVQYYQNQLLTSLPSWLQYQQSSQILSINVSNSSLQQDTNGNYIETLQQIVLTTYQEILSTAFIQSYLGINMQDSQNIYNACLQIGIINQQGFVDQSYSPRNELYLGFNQSILLSKWSGFKQQLVVNYIQFVLNMNIINYTISFKTANSLIIDASNKYQMITSVNSQDITLILQISKNQTKTVIESISQINPKFVNINYSGVLVLYSQIQDEVKIQGNMDSINRILQNGVRIYFDNDIPESEDLQIDVSISDSVNYDYQKTIPLSQITFIQKQTPVELSSSTSLQNEVNDRYDGGDIYVSQNFYFQISQDVFIQKQGNQLTYSAQMFSGGMFRDIPKNFWLSFSMTDRIFSGTPSPSQFYQSVRVRVNATDGYTSQTDIFEIKPIYIPFSYFLQIAIQVLGPLLGILGLYRFKYLIFNLIYNPYYTYSPDIVYVGQPYKKQITVTENIRPLSLQLWKYFLKRVGKKNLKNQLNEELSRQNQLTNLQFMEEHQYVYQQSLTESKQITDQSGFVNEIRKKILPFALKSDGIKGILNRRKQNSHISNMLQSLELFDQQRDPNKSIHKIEEIKNYPFQNQSKFIEQNEFSNKQNKHFNQTQEMKSFQKDQFNITQFQEQLNKFQNKNINKIESKNISENIKTSKNQQSKHLTNILQALKSQQQPNSLIKNQGTNNLQKVSVVIFKPNGDLNFGQILKYLQEQQMAQQVKKRILNQKQLEDLNHENSILSQAFYCLLVEFLINQNTVLKNVIQWMKTKAMKYYNQPDWYKAYLNIDPLFSDSKFGFYSHLKLCNSTFNHCLMELLQTIGKHHYFGVTRTSKPFNLSLTLLQEAIRIAGVGFSCNNPRYFYGSQGESIHIQQNQIHTIKAFEKDHRCCFHLRKSFGASYKQKSLSDNDKLPSWIHSLDLINGMIMIQGKPELKDVGTIIIQVIDQNKNILRSFEIVVLEKNIEQECTLQNHNEYSQDQGPIVEILSTSPKNFRLLKDSSFASKEKLISSPYHRKLKFGFQNNQSPRHFTLENDTKTFQDNDDVDEDQFYKSNTVNEQECTPISILRSVSNYESYATVKQVKRNETELLGFNLNDLEVQKMFPKSN